MISGAGFPWINSVLTVEGGLVMKLYHLHSVLILKMKERAGMKLHSNSERSIASQRMACIRCGGYLVKEEFVDLVGTCQPLATAACRCMNCGNVVDELIMRHQASPPPRPIKGGSHAPDR